MNILITTKAFKILLNVLLSCRCPISNEVEEKIIEYYKTGYLSDTLDYNELLKIAEQEDKETVFHRLKEFCLYSVDDLSKKYIISENDVLRHFSTGFHWRTIKDNLSSGYQKLTDIPSWFLSHMLMPIKLIGEGEIIFGKYERNNKEIYHRSIFIPKDLSLDFNDSYYCIHFGCVISEITQQQYDMIFRQLGEIEHFEDLMGRVREIDFKDFQSYGNYSEMCKKRYLKYFN